MKKILILSIATFSYMAMNAQVKFGIKANANLSKFSGSDAKMGDISPKFKVGFIGGGLANISISEILSVQPELLYSMEGSQYKEGDNKITYKTDYVNLPVMVQYNNPLGFYVETGPQVGFLVSAKAKSKAGDLEESEDVKDSFKSINFSWGLGLGYKLSNGLGIGARYNYGLLNVIDPNGEDTDVNIHLGGFQAGVFYTLGRNKK